MALTRRCVGCGKLFEVSGGEIICPYCGTRQSASITPEIGDILISAANYRRNGEFVAAFAEYKRVIAINPEIGESYWGAVLSEYHVAEEQNGWFTTVSKNSVFQNQNFNKALEFASYNRTKWTQFAENLELQRVENLSYYDEICKNSYHALIVADSNQKDLQTAFGLYEDLKSRVNVFYPRLTLKDFPPETALRVSLIAAEQIKLGFFLFSNDTKESQDFALMYQAFLKTKKPQFLFVVGEDEMIVPPSLLHNNKMILPDEGFSDEVLTQIRILGVLSLSERSELRNDGRLSKIQNNPSPIIFYKRSNL